MKHHTEKQGNWFARHKVLTVILAIFIIAVISSAAGGKEMDKKIPASPTASPASTSPADSTPPAKPKFDAAAFYDKVQTGMTKAEVTTAAGKDADNCTESEISGYGKTEYCTWYDGTFSTKFISITFKDNAVDGKSRNGF